MTYRIFWSRFAFVLMASVVLSWGMTDTFNRVTKSDYFSLSSWYSPVNQEFIVRRTTSSSSDFMTEDGKDLTTRQVSELLPFMFRSNLQKWQKFPVLIANRSFDYPTATKTQMIRMRPRLFHSALPAVSGLLESEPDSAELAMPEDVILIRESGIEFVRIADGKPDEKKTQEFMHALSAAHVKFPLISFASNVDVLKAFDDGAWMIDAERKVVNLKMAAGRPVVKVTETQAPEDISFISVSENNRKAVHGIIASASAMYLNTYENGLQEVPLRDFNAATDTVSVWATPLTNSVSQFRYDTRHRTGDQELVAADTDMEVLRVSTLPQSQDQVRKNELRTAWGSFISPLTVTQYLPERVGTFFDVRYADVPLMTLFGNAAALVIFAALRWIFICRGDNSRIRRRFFIKENLPAFVSVAIFGFPALIACLAFGPLSIQRSDA